MCSLIITFIQITPIGADGKSVLCLKLTESGQFWKFCKQFLNSDSSSVSISPNITRKNVQATVLSTFLYINAPQWEQYTHPLHRSVQYTQDMHQNEYKMHITCATRSTICRCTPLTLQGTHALKSPEAFNREPRQRSMTKRASVLDFVFGFF